MSASKLALCCFRMGFRIGLKDCFGDGTKEGAVDVAGVEESAEVTDVSSEPKQLSWEAEASRLEKVDEGDSHESLTLGSPILIIHKAQNRAIAGNRVWFVLATPAANDDSCCFVLLSRPVGYELRLIINGFQGLRVTHGSPW